MQAIDGALSFSGVFSHDAYLPQCMLLLQKMLSIAFPVPTKYMMANYYLNKPNIHAPYYLLSVLKAIEASIIILPRIFLIDSVWLNFSFYHGITMM